MAVKTVYSVIQTSIRFLLGDATYYGPDYKSRIDGLAQTTTTLCDENDNIITYKIKLETLNKKIQYIDKQINEETDRIRMYVKDNRQKARAALTRKKKLEQQRSQWQTLHDNIETQIERLSDVQLENEALSTMKQINDETTKRRAGITVDDVDRQLADIQIQMEEGHDISSAMSTAITQNSSFIDEELAEEELDQFLSEENYDTTLNKTRKSSNGKEEEEDQSEVDKELGKLEQEFQQPLPNNSHARQYNQQDVHTSTTQPNIQQQVLTRTPLS